MKKPNINISEFCDTMLKTVEIGIKDNEMLEYVPTGMLEPALISIGEFTNKGKTLIVNIQCANKSGKTALGAVILRNLFWDNDKTYFNYPNYFNWPFTQDLFDKDGDLVSIGNPVKQFRIVGTAKNTADDGPIRAEIKKWWPPAKYKALKGGKPYLSLYETDSGWEGDVLTFNQSPDEFEGPLKSVHWIDEPARAELMGAFTSRHSYGGIIFITQTPLNAGPMIDVLEDLREGGKVVKTVEGTIRDNSVKSGILNSKGTKRGLLTDEQIDDYEKGVPEEQKMARLYGKCMDKEGKIYRDFKDAIHVRDIDLSEQVFKKSNCYCVMDPHDRYYPFIQWWAVTPLMEDGRSRYICYNEWPQISTLGGFYDVQRATTECKYTPSDISNIINLMDLKHMGYQMRKRGIDPRFAKNSESNYSKKINGIVEEYISYGITFEIPDQVKLALMRDKIKDALKYTHPLTVFTESQVIILPHCINTSRSLTRHYWALDGEKEAEKYKDPCDCVKLFFSIVEPYVPPKSETMKMKRIIVQNIENEFRKATCEFSL